MENFVKKINQKFGDTVTNISKTATENKFINLNNYYMINLDKIAKYLKKNDDRFKGVEFTTADGLYAIKIKDKFQFDFFEFKKLDLTEEKDKLLSKYYLKQHVNILEEKKYDDETFQKLKDNSENLIDTRFCRLRTKPNESIYLLYYLLEDYFKNEDISTPILLSNIDKRFYIVSKTNIKIGYPHVPNRQNYNNRAIPEFNFLFKIQPYPYRYAAGIPEKTFKYIIKYLYAINELN